MDWYYPILGGALRGPAATTRIGRRWDDFVVRGSLEEGIFVGFYLTDGVVQAAVGFDRGGDPELDQDSEMAACVRLVASKARPDRERLANDRVALWSLVE